MISKRAGVASMLAPPPRTVRSVVERHPAYRLRPGDVFSTNDPWLCCGHLYDISVIKPLFHEGRLVGFGECLAHVPDVGGSLTNDSREVYEEGVCLPVVRFVSEGDDRSEEHTSELQSLMRISYAVFCLKKKKTETDNQQPKLMTESQTLTIYSRNR